MDSLVCGAISLLAVVFVQGPAVTLAVQLLKRIQWVADNPLRAAALLNALAALASGVAICGVQPGSLLSQLAAGFLASVGTYETAKALGEANETPWARWFTKAQSSPPPDTQGQSSDKNSDRLAE